MLLRLIVSRLFSLKSCMHSSLFAAFNDKFSPLDIMV